MDLTNPHFAEPGWLWLAAVAPLLFFGLQQYAAWMRRKQLAQLAVTGSLENLTASHSPWRRRLKNLLLLLSAAGMAVALARPQWGEQAEVAQALGEDVLFVLDCSRSMLATDVRPNRLQRARLSILDFIQRHSRGRVGLVAFAGQAFLQCPLTFDYDAFREALLAVDERTIPVLGTHLGRALEEAFMAMEKNARRKILVLLTDGEDLEKDGARQAKELAGKGVVVFTLGVGTPAGGVIQFFNEQGALEVVRDAAGKAVESRLDETTLKTIAEATHGRYQPLGPAGEGMLQLRQAIETLTDLPGVAITRKLGIDHFHVPLAVVIFLLAAEALVGTRKRSYDRQLARLRQGPRPASLKQDS
jgi:Ca-activated chloride channel family protein